MLNNVVLQGRFSRDPEIKTTPSGALVSSFPLACDKYTNGNKQTDWFDVVAWNKTAEFIAAHFSKGDTIIVVGRLQTRSYQSKGGETHKVCEILVDKCEFSGAAKAPEQTAPEQTAPVAAVVPEEPVADPEDETIELPFEI